VHAAGGIHLRRSAQRERRRRAGGLGRKQSKRALAESARGCFSLRKKPLGIALSGYSYSGFAIAATGRGCGSSLFARTGVLLLTHAPEIMRLDGHEPWDEWGVVRMGRTWRRWRR
jgi:hypothetical protein